MEIPVGSASDSVVFLHLRDNRRIRELVRALDRYDALRRTLGSTETLLQLQLRFTRPEEQERVRLAELTDDIVVVPVKVLVVVLLVLLLPATLRAAIFDRRNSPLNGRSWSKSLNNARCTAQFAVFFCTLGDWIQMS
jgi:hypothetical protein